MYFRWFVMGATILGVCYFRAWEHFPYISPIFTYPSWDRICSSCHLATNSGSVVDFGTYLLHLFSLLVSASTPFSISVDSTLPSLSSSSTTDLQQNISCATMMLLHPRIVSLYIVRVASVTLLSFLSWCLLWLTKGFVLQCLLSYHGWMFGKPTWRTKVWALSVRLLSGRHPKMYDLQSYLPHLPLPSLTSTVEKYLTSVKPLLTPTEFAATAAAARSFTQGVGRKLQLYLHWRRLTHANWIEDWWLRFIYLRGRKPIAIHSNFYAVDGGGMPPGYVTQTRRAACAIAKMLKFRRKCINGNAPATRLQDCVPFCMEGYRQLFATTRIPGRETDELVHYPDSKHICVLHQSRIFSFPVLGVDGDAEEILSVENISLQIDRILAGTYSVHSTHGDLEVLGVPALTGARRDSWAEVREDMILRLADDETDEVSIENRDIYLANQRALHEVESSLFVVCLDDVSPQGVQDICRESMHGNGSNRWFDKSFQLLAFANGRVALNVEHSFADAPIAAHCWEYVMATEPLEHVKDTGAASLSPLPPPCESLAKPVLQRFVNTHPPVTETSLNSLESLIASVTAATEAAANTPTTTATAMPTVPPGAIASIEPGSDFEEESCSSGETSPTSSTPALAKLARSASFSSLSASPSSTAPDGDIPLTRESIEGTSSIISSLKSSLSSGSLSSLASLASSTRSPEAASSSSSPSPSPSSTSMKRSKSSRAAPLMNPTRMVPSLSSPSLITLGMPIKSPGRDLKGCITLASFATKRMINELQMHTLDFTVFGKGHPKSIGMSPDGFFQMAMQLAYYRYTEGETPLTYESASTRMFYHGRTATVRVVSDASLDFVKAMAAMYGDACRGKTDYSDGSNNAIKRTHSCDGSTMTAMAAKAANKEGGNAGLTPKEGASTDVTSPSTHSTTAFTAKKTSSMSMYPPAPPPSSLRAQPPTARSLDPATRRKIEIASLLREAVNYQNQYAKEAMCGADVDRHMFGLYVTARGMGMGDTSALPDLFNDKSFNLPWNLSTSQTPYRQTKYYEKGRASAGGGFGPVCPGGFGVSYIVVGEDRVFFHISSWRDEALDKVGARGATPSSSSINSGTAGSEDVMNRTKSAHCMKLANGDSGGRGGHDGNIGNIDNAHHPRVGVFGTAHSVSSVNNNRKSYRFAQCIRQSLEDMKDVTTFAGIKG